LVPNLDTTNGAVGKIVKRCYYSEELNAVIIRKNFELDFFFSYTKYFKVKLSPLNE